MPDARCLEGDRCARRAALRDACRRMRFLRCCALLMDMLCLQQRAEALRQLSALIGQHSFSHAVFRHPGKHRQEKRPGNCRRRGQVGHGGTSSHPATARAGSSLPAANVRARRSKPEVESMKTDDVARILTTGGLATVLLAPVTPVEAYRCEVVPPDHQVGHASRCRCNRPATEARCDHTSRPRPYSCQVGDLPRLSGLAITH